jgi:hypothetical protein
MKVIAESGKADGQGKSVGKDSYEGEFRAGLPDGKGIYIWENKDWFEGSGKKANAKGEGTLHITGGGTKDSVVVGFWKKDKYAGRYERAYQVLSQSQTISTVTVTELKDSKFNEIAFILSSVTGGTNTLSSQMKTGTPLPKIKLTSVDVTKGIIMDIAKYLISQRPPSLSSERLCSLLLHFSDQIPILLRSHFMKKAIT